MLKNSHQEINTKTMKLTDQKHAKEMKIMQEKHERHGDHGGKTQKGYGTHG